MVKVQAIRRLLAFFLLAGAVSCRAQQWEIGAATGYGLYRNGSIYAPAGKATAGIRNRFVAGVVIAEDRYEHLTGELRYTYQDGDPFLSAGAVKTNLQGQSHSLHYDFLFHARPRRERIRPYLAAGMGIKLYEVSGPANPAQPLTDIAVLQSTDQLKTLFTVGGGVKMRMSRHVLLRFDFRDYLTTFPRQQLIQPAPLATARGIFQQFTPMAGISFVP